MDPDGAIYIQIKHESLVTSERSAGSLEIHSSNVFSFGVIVHKNRFDWEVAFAQMLRTLPMIWNSETGNFHFRKYTRSDIFPVN